MSKQWLFTEGGECRASLSARDCGIEGIAHGTAVQFDAATAELQRQNAECLIWLEENRKRIYCVSFGIFQWHITLKRMGRRFIGETLHEAISTAREAEKQAK